MKKYKIILSGCDSTKFEMELSSEEFELVKRMAELSQETSMCSCMPVIYIADENDERIF